MESLLFTIQLNCLDDLRIYTQNGVIIAFSYLGIYAILFRLVVLKALSLELAALVSALSTDLVEMPLLRFRPRTFESKTLETGTRDLCF
jgi:hypothetical protein